MRGSGQLLPTIEALRGRCGREADSPDLDDAYPEAIHLASAVRRTLRAVPLESPCLTQSLVLTGLLARHQIPSSLVIGVRPGDDFVAHAWVEYRRRALLPASAGRLERLTVI